MNILPAYKLISHEYIKEVSSEAYLLEHIKSGAHVYVLENNDPNKVFSIAFRTPVNDSTGVPHIIEHSVLCGSERFPVKDPFMELAKTSLNTFLNAITFPDKTVYPVASCNYADFCNLMKVYVDAVFKPNIYNNENIFRQEGWHYEVAEDGSLSVNGVVYNEMKGAMSDPMETFGQELEACLFPDTGYGQNYGGEPSHIPELSYEQFLAFHSKYYHPSNSYIYLYGDCDMADRLAWLDTEYLCKYDATKPDSEITLQPAFNAPVYSKSYYPVNELEPDDKKAWIGTAWVTGLMTDPELSLAFQIIDLAILSTEGAPLRQALSDSGLSDDICGGYYSDYYQPYFSVVLKDADPDCTDKAVKLIDDTLRKIADEGIGHKALQAAINSIEFRVREGDTGSYPMGLLVNFDVLSSWLYDGDPAAQLKYDHLFGIYKSHIDDGYFEEIIRKYLINNNHRATLTLLPSDTLQKEREDRDCESLEKLRQSLSTEELERIKKNESALRDFQETPDSQEALDTIPKLTISEIDKTIPKLSTVCDELSGIPVLFHEAETKGITYLSLLYDLDDIAKEDIPYLGLMRSLFTVMDTEKYTFADLSREIDICSGGISFSINVINPYNDNNYYPKLRISTKYLHGNADAVYTLLEEIRDRTDFSDVKRLKNRLKVIKSRLQMDMEGSLHSTAFRRALSYSADCDKYSELTDGIDYLRFISKISDADDSELKDLSIKLKTLCDSVFNQSKLVISITDTAEGRNLTVDALGKHFTYISHIEPKGGPAFKKERLNEALITAGQVNYVSQVGRYTEKGLPYTGALHVLRSIMNDDYLWQKLRVKGGAYGGFSGFSKEGFGFFVSYRDPHIAESYETYKQAADFIRNSEFSEDEISDYTIGTIGKMYGPMTPFMFGNASLIAYLCGITDEFREKEKAEILSCTPEVIRSLAPYIEVIADGDVCTVGTASQIEETKQLFANIDKLY